MERRKTWRARAQCVALALAVLVLLCARWRCASAHVVALDAQLRMPGEMLRRDALADDVQNVTLSAYEDALALLLRYERVVIGGMLPLAFCMALFGHVLLVPTLFVAGFALGGYLSYALALRLLAGSPAVAWVSITACVLGGLLLALLCVALLKVGVFSLGAAAGVFVAFALRSVIESRVENEADVVFWAVCAVLATLLGLIALLLETPMIIFCTAFGGAFGFVYGIAFFAHKSDAQFWNSAAPPQARWGCFAGFIVLGLLGLLVQFIILRRSDRSDGEPFLPLKRRHSSSLYGFRGYQPTQPSDFDHQVDHAILSERPNSMSSPPTAPITMPVATHIDHRTDEP
ncbi:hypothetical protein FVE85_3397 [Porphyridium purpureum]|uniref:Transmembrane protein 198 n=1 Tax=Porphyridium purpureum TaxID=35688 RepID=A0A5J4YUX8_PORPP|nr:hypothetical protein FVE85_3397 [Porphyridium purpureum]|eukprot:POR7479..scf227_4